MLSTAAWNAFLKTLEEPPPNTVFVLATTEANKVPATVVDRCHRFDFHRPTVEQIASVVRRTAQAESIEIPPPAIAALARSATGSFRDALGTLEQLVTYSGSQIALEDVLAVLGVADARLLEAAVDAVADDDPRRALAALDECVEQGRDASSFASDLEVRARELMVVQILGEVPEELSLTPEADAALREQAERVAHATVVRLLELLGEAMEAVRAGADARTRLELALVKAARPAVDGSMRALLTRIERLEGVAPARANAPVATPADEQHAVEQGPPPAAPVPGVAGAQADQAPTRSESSPPQDQPDFSRGGDAPPPATGAAPAVSTAAASSSAALMTGSPASLPPAPPPEAIARVPRDLESIFAFWPAVVDLVRSENGLLGAVLGEACPVAVDGEELTLAITSSLSKKKAEDPAHRAAVGEALRSLTGERWRLSYELREEAVSADRPEPTERSEDEWVARFMQEFDAEELTEDEAVTSDEKGA